MDLKDNFLPLDWCIKLSQQGIKFKDCNAYYELIDCKEIQDCEEENINFIYIAVDNPILLEGNSENMFWIYSEKCEYLSERSIYFSSLERSRAYPKAPTLEELIDKLPVSVGVYHRRIKPNHWITYENINFYDEELSIKYEVYDKDIKIACAKMLLLLKESNQLD